MGWMLWPWGVGWKERERTLRLGTFECRNPSCKGKRNADLQQFRLRQHRNWIIILYLPVLPLNRTGMSVQCASCKTRYTLDVLSEEELATLVGSPDRPWVEPARPGASVRADLAASAETSEGRPSMASAPSSPAEPFFCHSCGASLRRDARFCGACGTAVPVGGEGPLAPPPIDPRRR
jgi:hypothetical protein